jgi:hypothetical protein
MVINLSKCTFMVPELEVLGDIINSVGTTPTPQHVQVITDYPPPQDTKQLQRYLGMVNFYRRFTPGSAKVLEPLPTELKGGKKTLQWSPHLDAAFNKSKQVLANAVPLAHPAPDAAIAVATHIGGVLNQQVRGPWQPLGFFSRKLNVAETKYSTFDRELLAAAQTIRHFRHILEGRDFQLWTDHKPLVTAISRISEPSPRPDSRDIWQPLPNSLRISGTSQVLRTWLPMPCPALPTRGPPPPTMPPRPQRPWKTQLIFRQWRQSRQAVLRPRSSSRDPQP